MPITDLSEEEEAEFATQRTESNETTKTMSITPPEQSHRPGGAGRRNTPSPMMKGLSTALMQGAFEKFGNAFTATGDVAADRSSSDQRMAPFRQAGATVASRLEDRWFRMEYENFQSNQVEPYIQAKKAMMDDYQRLNSMLNEGRYPTVEGEPPEQFDINTPEGRMQALRARTQLFNRFYQTNADMDMQLADQAYKYPHNPIIDKRIQAIVEAGQKGLMQQAAPQEVIDAEGSAQDQRRSDEQLLINKQMANAQSSAAKTAAKKTQTIDEFLNDPNGGVTKVLQWMETGHGAQWLASPTAAAYLNEGTAILREQIHLRNEAEAEAAGEDYDREDPLVMAGVEATIERNGGAVQRAGAVALLKSVDPAAAKEARKHAPHFYELIPEEGLPGQAAAALQRKTPNKRIGKAQVKKNVKSWREPLKARLKEYMENPDNDPSLEAVRAAVIDEWLPEAIRGRASSSAPEGILAGDSAEMDAYAAQVQEEMGAWFDKHWSRMSKLLAEQHPGKARKANRRGRRGGPSLIDKGIQALFD